MQQDISSEISNLIKEIKNVVSAEKIYLFGSYAYGNPTEDSDIDLCVVTDDVNMRKLDIIRKIRKSISNVATMPIDLVVYYNHEFTERATLDCTMEHKIAHEGVDLYEQ